MFFIISIIIIALYFVCYIRCFNYVYGTNINNENNIFVNSITNNIKDSIFKLKDKEIKEINKKRKHKRNNKKLKYLGMCKVTGYSYHDDGGSINYHTSTGKTPKPYKTCAVDPATISYNTKLYIPDLKLNVVAEDCGGAVSGKHIDVHVGYDNPDNIIGNNCHKVYIRE